jgi:hypothetical protein
MAHKVRVYLYAQKAWAEKRKHSLSIPLCPKNMGRKEETLFEYTFMPKNMGRKEENNDGTICPDYY